MIKQGRLLRIKRKLVIGIINHFLSGTRFFKLKARLLRASGVDCASTAQVVGPIYIGGVIRVSIGEYTWVGTETKFYGNGSVKIGSYCDIAPEVAFVTGSHAINDTDDKRAAGNGISYNINIEDGCWIGVRATLMGNINVANKCVIGACSLLNKSTLPQEIIAGIPAMKIRNL